jgi:PAS domain-containing protein
LEVTASNRLGDAAVAGIVLNFHDVTDETKAMTDLRRVEAAVAQASDAVMIADVHANIEYVNPAFELITSTIGENRVASRKRGNSRMAGEPVVASFMGCGPG